MSVLFIAAAAVQAASAPSIEITNFAGEVRIEPGAALGVRVDRPDAEGPVEITETADGLIIDGGRDMRRWRCRGGWREDRVGPDRRSRRAFDELPLLVITSPEPAALDLDESIVRAEAGDLASLDLDLAHCGAFEAGDVAGDAVIALSGSTDVSLDDVAGGVTIALSGAGGVSVASSAGAEVSASGSGGADLGDMAGPLTVRLSGSGDVRAGEAASVDARTSGSGDITVGAVVGGINFSSSGSGDLSAERMNGALDAALGGSGDVAIEAGRAEPFQVRATGSGGVDFGGTAVNVSVRLTGSGDVEVAAVEGDQDLRTTGSGDFEVGG